MTPWVFPSLLTTFAVLLALVARAEPQVRRESNASIRNEVQLAIDKALAHLQSTQRADGTWGRVGTTGFVLMALQRDPRGRGNSLRKGAEFAAALQKGYAGLRQAFPEKGDLQQMDDFAWNVPPAVLALRTDPDDRSVELGNRARQAIGAAPFPQAKETRALFLALDPRNRDPGDWPSPATGSSMAAYLWIQLQRVANPAMRGPFHTFREVDFVTAWLRKNYTLERNPGGEGVHQYYFWLSSILGEPPRPGAPPILAVPSVLDSANGVTVDIPRQLAETLINEQNGNGSWSGVGDHWTEKDPDLVAAFCVLTLEQVYGQL